MWKILSPILFNHWVLSRQAHNLFEKIGRRIVQAPTIHPLWTTNSWTLKTVESSHPLTFFTTVDVLLQLFDLGSSTRFAVHSDSEHPMGFYGNNKSFHNNRDFVVIRN